MTAGDRARQGARRRVTPQIVALSSALLASAVFRPLIPTAAVAHSPSVTYAEASTPDQAIVLEDPTLSRALGSVLREPGEIDWYRMDLQAGDALVVGITAPDASGAVAATFTLLGPGLPDVDASDVRTWELMGLAGVDGAVTFQPLADPPLEVHAGLGFVNYGSLRTQAPETGTYWIAVSAVDPNTTGKYVLAPGLREEFGLEALGGMVDLIAFFDAPWPMSGEPVDEGRARGET
jgi:hypothetical protein